MSTLEPLTQDELAILKIKYGRKKLLLALVIVTVLFWMLHSILLKTATATMSYAWFVGYVLVCFITYNRLPRTVVDFTSINDDQEKVLAQAQLIYPEVEAYMVKILRSRNHVLVIDYARIKIRIDELNQKKEDALKKQAAETATSA